MLVCAGDVGWLGEFFGCELGRLLAPLQEHAFMEAGWPPELSWGDRLGLKCEEKGWC